MTQSEAVQKIYRWAFEVTANKNSSVLDLYCARAIQNTVEFHDRHDEAYAAIVRMVSDWRAQRRQSLEQPLKAILPMIGLAVEYPTTSYSE